MKCVATMQTTQWLCVQEVNSRRGTLTRYRGKKHSTVNVVRPEQGHVFEKCRSCSEIITLKVSTFGPNGANVVSPLDGGGQVSCRTHCHIPVAPLQHFLDTEALLFIAAPGVRGSERRAGSELLLKEQRGAIKADQSGSVNPEQLSRALVYPIKPAPLERAGCFLNSCLCLFKRCNLIHYSPIQFFFSNQVKMH